MDLPGIPEAYLENTPLGRNGTPDEVAATIRFLLSADSTWITGEDIQLDGGSHLMRYPDLHGVEMAALVCAAAPGVRRTKSAPRGNSWDASPVTSLITLYWEEHRWGKNVLGTVCSRWWPFHK